MRSDNDQVFGNSIESSEENTVLKIPGNGKEAECEVFNYTRSDEGEKENDRNMSGNHSSGFKIDPKNEDIRENRNGVEDPRVFYMDNSVMEKLLFNEKDSVKVNFNPFGSKSSEDSKFGTFVGNEDSNKLNQETLIVIGQEFKDDSGVGCENSPLRDVLATSRSVALTLGDIISLEDSHISPNNNNLINGPEENVDNETEPEKTEEAKADNLTYLSSDMLEPENQRQNNLFLSNFSNGFGERSFSEAESGLAHISYSGPISISGSLSVRSDGSTVSARSFAFPILESEWNSSPVRMVKAEKTDIRKEKGWRHYSLLLCCRF